MKKLFAVLALSAVLFACNSGASSDDSEQQPTEEVAPSTDTQAPADQTTAPAATDSTATAPSADSTSAQ